VKDNWYGVGQENTIHFCPWYFTARSWDTRAGQLPHLANSAGIFLHELSHLAAGTDDLHGEWYPDNSPGMGPEDAYWMQQFEGTTGTVEHLTEHYIWPLIWPK